jgi:hypothetical protein
MKGMTGPVGVVDMLPAAKEPKKLADWVMG